MEKTRQNKRESEKGTFSKLKAILELARFEHGIMYGLAVFIGIVLVSGFSSIFALPPVLGFLTALLIEMGAFALNDYIDLKADIINKRYDRPLVRGDIKRETALHTTIICFFAGIILSFFISLECLSVAVLFSLMSVAYNYKLKRYSILGNLFIAATMALPFVFGALIAGSINEAILVLSGIVFIIGLGREMMKDIEDMKGDKAIGAKTLPILVGPKRATYSIAICYILGIFLSALPVLTFFKMKPLYLSIIPVDLIFLYVSFSILKRQDIITLKRGRKLTLLGSALALVAFFLAAVS